MVLTDCKVGANQLRDWCVPIDKLVLTDNMIGTDQFYFGADQIIIRCRLIELLVLAKILVY